MVGFISFDGLPTVLPRDQLLGLVEGATPALLDRMGRYLADAGATQESVLQRLREQHHVHWGVQRLRDAADALAGLLDEFRNEHQVQRLLELLHAAEASQGRHRPVLSVGRDGITLWTQPHGFFEVATAATLAVFGRRGRRLGTVYLAYAPELGQGTMTDQLTRLLRDVLAAYAGPPPRLCYVTDAGDHETASGGHIPGPGNRWCFYAQYTICCDFPPPLNVCDTTYAKGGWVWTDPDLFFGERDRACPVRGCHPDGRDPFAGATGK